MPKCCKRSCSYVLHHTHVLIFDGQFNTNFNYSSHSPLNQLMISLQATCSTLMTLRGMNSTIHPANETDGSMRAPEMRASLTQMF